MLLRTILVVAADVVAAEAAVVVEALAVADSVALVALVALDAAVAVDVVDVVDVPELADALESAWTEYALSNSYFLIVTLLKGKCFYMNFNVETLFFKYNKSLFSFSFDIRKIRIHKIVMMEVIMH